MSDAYYCDIFPNTEKQYKEMIKVSKDTGKFCSIALYERISTKSKKYMTLNLLNLNFNDSDHVDLGMVITKDSMPATRVEDLMKKRLHEFGLKMKNIVAATTDRASVMKSFERLISYVHQHCFSCGYHLELLISCMQSKISLND